MTVTDKGGNNTVDLCDTTVQRDLKVTTKDGNDTIVIKSGSQVDGKTSLSPGHGNNTITVDDAVIGGAFVFKGGNNVDIFNLERDGNGAGPRTTFMSKTSFKMGKGNDILRIGRAGSDGESATSDDKVTLDGGKDNDTLLADPKTQAGGPNDNLFTQTPTVKDFENLI